MIFHHSPIGRAIEITTSPPLGNPGPMNSLTALSAVELVTEYHRRKIFRGGLGETIHGASPLAAALGVKILY